MSGKIWNQPKTDLLVIGSGASGFSAAIEAARTGCALLIVDKGLIGKYGCTIMAEQIAAVVQGNLESDSTEIHYQDTIRAGRELNNPSLIRIMVREAL